MDDGNLGSVVDFGLNATNSTSLFGPDGRWWMTTVNRTGAWNDCDIHIGLTGNQFRSFLNSALPNTLVTIQHLSIEEKREARKKERLVLSPISRLQVLFKKRLDDC